jgi:hypothetical protein
MDTGMNGQGGVNTDLASILQAIPAGTVAGA